MSRFLIPAASSTTTQGKKKSAKSVHSASRLCQFSFPDKKERTAHPLNPLGGEAGAGNRRAAAERLELALDNLAGVVDANLELHHVAARGRADEARADVRVVLVEASDVARVLVVVDDAVVVGAGADGGGGGGAGGGARGEGQAPKGGAAQHGRRRERVRRWRCCWGRKVARGEDGRWWREGVAERLGEAGRGFDRGGEVKVKRFDVRCDEYDRMP